MVPLNALSTDVARSESAPCDSTPRTLTCPLLLLALVTGLLVQAQLVASTIWTLLTGHGVYSHTGHALFGIATYFIGSVLACSAPGSVVRAVDAFPVVRYLRITAVLLGLLIVYPAAFHYFYDIPAALIAGGVLAFNVLGVAALYSSRWLPAFSFGVVLTMGSFLNVPHYYWDITDLRHTLNVLAILNAVIIVASLDSLLQRCGYRRFTAHLFQSEERLELAIPFRAAIASLLAASFAVSYFYAGLGKVILSSQTPWLIDGVRWIWQERLDVLFQMFWHMGATWIVPLELAESAFGLFNNVWSRSAAHLLVLAGELTVIAVFFSRRAFVAGILACQVLHVGFAFVASTYFIHWFTLNFVFLAVFSKPVYAELHELLSCRQRVILTGAVLVAAPLVLNTTMLSWCTTNDDVRIFTWHLAPASAIPSDAVPESMTAAEYFASHPQVNPNLFFPYEKNFQMSWRFPRVVGPPAVAHRRHPLSDQLPRWYKLRLTGEWHEHLPHVIDELRLASDLQRLLDRHHQQQLHPRPSLWPRFGSHMAYHPNFFRAITPHDLGASAEYELVEQTLLDRGTLEMERRIHPLYRVSLTPITARHEDALRR